MADRRIYAGYYKRYDGKLIYVVTMAEDADSGEDVVIWTPFTYSESHQYFTMSKKSFCEYVVVDGKRQAKFKRQTQMKISDSVIESYEAEGFRGPMRKETTRPVDEYDDWHRPRAATYHEYAKDLCEQYSFLLRKYQLCVVEKKYIGIQKSGYIKSGGGGAGNYMKYIATRDGVELRSGDGPVSEKQQQFIADLLRDFPDAVSLDEYDDYKAAPTAASASAFISAALDENAHALQESDRYMRYIATRPRAEKHGEHGLFGSSPEVSLEDSMKTVSEHQGPVWTFIYSLKREDAARLGYDSAESWRRLIMAHQVELAEAMKIPPSQFRWCAAFHDESHHPHIHMMVWSDGPKLGYLTEDGIEKMRSKLTNDIFQDELLSLYQQKDVSYKEVTEAARDAMKELIRQMKNGSILTRSPASVIFL